MRPQRRTQRGAALLVVLLVAGVLGAFFALRAFNAGVDREKSTTAALAQAKDALIGSAATYRDTHPTEVPGLLLLPDMGSTRNSANGEGVSGGAFTGPSNVRYLGAIGRLPWRTLGLAPLRDGAGECLWYAVSGTFQDAFQSRFVNWDTLGQFETFTSDGTPAGTVSAVGANAHRRPVAVVFAPGQTLAGQLRSAIGANTVTECQGNYDARNYLDTFAPNVAINNIVNYLGGFNNSTGAYVLASPKQVLPGPVVNPAGATLVNDRMLTITADELFRAVRTRGDFVTFVNNSLLATVASNLPYGPPLFDRPASLNFSTLPPTETTGGAVMGSVEIGRVPLAGLTNTPLRTWQDNMLYARCNSGLNCLTLNDLTHATVLSCSGVVIFAGERTVAQLRATNAQKNTWSNYLEGAVLAAFTGGGTVYTGPTSYDATSPVSDVLQCVAPMPGVTQTTFAANMGSFVAVGGGVVSDLSNRLLSLTPFAGASGGCFWSSTRMGVAGKTVRAYYEFVFLQKDDYALTGSGTDLGNGFSMQMVSGQFLVPPSNCGPKADMGVLGSVDLWGHDSFIFETDVHREVGHDDPVENHSAILADGFLDHAPAAPSATINTACNGTATGCRHSPPNKFEETPPQKHNQRIEIHSGCDASCAVCNPPAHGAPNNYVRITAWVDCKDCDNTAINQNRVLQVPTIQRCKLLDAALDTMYFGLTGGFQTGASAQGVTISNLVVRSE